MIELKGVSKIYTGSSSPAVDNLTLTVKSGEIFGFLGPNGAGKTTTIKLMTGLLQPSSGTVLVGEKDIATHPIDVKRNLGYVPDTPVLYERMSGVRFLSFIADAYGVREANRNRIEELGRDFELTDVLNDPISSYSHGMKQKISIIAAFLHDPDIYILDEPIQGLDPHSAFVLKEKMKQACGAGKTVFFSTHVMEVAERLCDRVGIIRRGRMIAEGPFEDLRTTAGTDTATLEKLFLELTDDIAAAD